MVRSRLIVITGRHIRAARALLGWPQSKLSTRSGVALRTIRRMEGFDDAVGARTGTLAKVVAVLEKAGVEFLDGDLPGVRLRAVHPKAEPPARGHPGDGRRK